MIDSEKKREYNKRYNQKRPEARREANRRYRKRHPSTIGRLIAWKIQRKKERLEDPGLVKYLEFIYNSRRTEYERSPEHWDQHRPVYIKYWFMTKNTIKRKPCIRPEEIAKLLRINSDLKMLGEFMRLLNEPGRKSKTNGNRSAGYEPDRTNQSDSKERRLRPLLRKRTVHLRRVKMLLEGKMPGNVDDLQLRSDKVKGYRNIQMKLLKAEVEDPAENGEKIGQFTKDEFIEAINNFADTGFL